MTTSKPPTVKVTGDNVQVGDVLLFLGNTHRVDRIEPASHATCEMFEDPQARVAYAGTWPMTLTRRQHYPILARPQA